MENILNNEDLRENVTVLDDTLNETMNNKLQTTTDNTVTAGNVVNAMLQAKMINDNTHQYVETTTTPHIEIPNQQQYVTKIPGNIEGMNIVTPLVKEGMAAPKTIDLSDLPMDDDASYSSVLGNLDDEPLTTYADDLSMRGNNNTNVHYHTELEGLNNDPVPTVKNELDFGVNFSAEEIDFSKDANTTEFSAEDALTEDVIKQSKDEENYIYHSYADQKISHRGNNSKLSFLDKISVDLKDVTITKKSPIEQVEDINAMFNNNIATFTVTCCQSGYWASMSGLTLAEKNAINNSDGGSIFQFRQKLYHTVYNKIQAMSIPKPNFNNWLKITSFNDLATLLFGIYCQTFIDNNDFDITCGKCGKTTSVTVNNQSLVEVRDRSVFEKRDEIIGTIENGEQLVANSIVHKDERIMLNESKIIVDVATPSLHDHLTLLQSSKQETLQEYADTFSAMLFISHLYMLNIRETYNTGKPAYYEIDDKARLLNILLKLSNNDGEQLENAIQEKLGKYQINYEIHNVTCSHCKSQLPGIPVDMENILFTRLNRTNTER